MKKYIYIVVSIVCALCLGACALLQSHGAKIVYQDEKRTISAGIDSVSVLGQPQQKKNCCGI